MNREGMTLKLVKETPTWGHLITTREYHRDLVKRQLLASPARASLNDVITSFDRHRRMVIEFLAEIGVESAIKLAECKTADTALDEASKASCVIAACNIVEEFQGSPKGPIMAEAMIKKGVSLPPILKEKLTAMLP